MYTESGLNVEVKKENKQSVIVITIPIDEFEANSGLSMTVASTRGIVKTGVMYDGTELFCSVHLGYKLELTPQEHDRLTKEAEQRKIQRAKEVLINAKITDDWLLKSTKKTPVIENYWTQDKKNMPVRVA
jgi:hypothetical protein